MSIWVVKRRAANYEVEQANLKRKLERTDLCTAQRKRLEQRLEDIKGRLIPAITAEYFRGLPDDGWSGLLGMNDSYVPPSVLQQN
ncbi:MAG: hypothetical protein M1355_00405 [Patescibacteria group bacterium]|nr:hypothetical protein [Patescibacteria group bacterium]